MITTISNLQQQEISKEKLTQCEAESRLTQSRSSVAFIRSIGGMVGQIPCLSRGDTVHDDEMIRLLISDFMHC